MVEMNSIPWSPVLRYATPLPMNRNPVSTVVLQHKSVSSIFAVRDTTADQQDPICTVGGPGEVRFLCFAVRQTRPDENDPVSTVAGQTQDCFLRSAVCQASFPSAVPSKPVGSQ